MYEISALVVDNRVPERPALEVARRGRDGDSPADLIREVTSALYGWLSTVEPGQLDEIEGEPAETGAYLAAQVGGRQLVVCLNCLVHWAALGQDVQAAAGLHVDRAEHGGKGCRLTDVVALFVPAFAVDRAREARATATEVFDEPVQADGPVQTVEAVQAWHRMYARAKGDACRRVMTIMTSGAPGAHLFRKKLTEDVAAWLRGAGWRQLNTEDVARDAVSELIATSQLSTDHDDASCVFWPGPAPIRPEQTTVAIGASLDWILSHILNSEGQRAVRSDAGARYSQLYVGQSPAPFRVAWELAEHDGLIEQVADAPSYWFVTTRGLARLAKVTK